MKKTKWILALLLFFITFSSFLTIWHINESIKVNYSYPFRLDKNYVSFTVDKENENSEQFLNDLLDTVKDKPITIIAENKDQKQLRLFDGLGLYLDYPLFIGYYFKQSQFVEKQKVALLQVEVNNTDPTNEIQIGEENYKIIGEFDENYVLAQNGATQILPLFSSAEIVGTYYIQCDDKNLLNTVTTMFETNLHSTKASTKTITLRDILLYVNEDKQTGMIMVVLFLSFITFMISDYILLARNKKEYAIRYLVGARSNILLGKQIREIIIPYAFSCSLSALLSLIIIKTLGFPYLEIQLIVLFVFVFFVISTIGHIVITLLLLSEVEKEVLR